MKIVKHRERITTVEYRRSFTLITTIREFHGSGIEIDCDKDGNIDMSSLRPAAQKNYKDYLAASKGESEGIWHMKGVRYRSGKDGQYIPYYCTGGWMLFQVQDNGIVETEHSHIEPAEGICKCGDTVYLSGFTNTCDCGKDYNMSGQELAPREFWGEETGETASDILRG